MAALDLGSAQSNDVVFVTCKVCNHAYAVAVLDGGSTITAKDGSTYFDCPRCGSHAITAQDMTQLDVPGTGGLLARYIYALNTLFTQKAAEDLPSKRPRQ